MYASCHGCTNGLLYSADGGASWQPLLAGAQLNGVWSADGGANVYAVGDGGSAFKGSATSFAPTTISVAATNNLNAIWGTGGELFVAGANNSILHFTGGGWVSENIVGTKNLLGVWGSSTTNVYVVGQAGAVFHKQGATANWPSENSTVGVDLTSVGGSSASDVYAIGDTAILHSTGSTWSSQTQPLSLKFVQAASASEVWIAGAQWSLLHGSGSNFSTVPTGLVATAPDTLRAIMVFATGELFVGGDRQTILHHL
jgi:hypothetical protein